MNATFWQSGWAVFGGLVAAEIALIGVVAWLAQARMRTAAARSVVWQSALLAVFAVTLGEFAGAGPALVRNLRAEVAVEAPLDSEAAPELLPPLATEGMMQIEGGNPLIRELVAQKLAEREAALEANPGSEPLLASTQAPVMVDEPALPIPWAWGAGAAALLALLGLRRAGFWLCSLRFEKADCPRLLARIKSVAERLGMRSAARALTSPRLATPVAFGLLRPTVGLPDNFESANTDARKDAMLAHELAHLRARDPWWHLGADLMVAALWWHPIAWWIARQLKQTSESAADEASACVENGPEALAECLVEFGRQLAKGSPANAIGMAGDGYRSRLGNRVEALLKLPGKAGAAHAMKFATLRRLGVAIGLAGAGLLLAACCAPDSAADARSPLASVREGNAAEEQSPRVLNQAKNDTKSRLHPDDRSLPDSEPDVGDQDNKWQPAELTQDGVEGSRTASPRSNASATGNQTEFPPNRSAVGKRVIELLRDGKLLYEQSRFDEARKLFRKAIELDPKSKAAHYYLSLVQEAELAESAKPRNRPASRTLGQIEQAWNHGLPLTPTYLPETPPFSLTNNAAEDGRVTRILKLDPERLLVNLQRLAPGARFPGFINAAPAANGGNQRGVGAMVSAKQTNAVSEIAVRLRELLLAAGVSTNPPPQLFYKDKAGVLMVSAKPDDLEAIKSLVALLNLKPSERAAGSAERLVERGKAYYDARRFEEATAALKKALELEPTHQLAAYYLALVEHAEQRRTPESTIVANDLPDQLRGRHFRTNAVNRTSVRRQQILRLVNTLRIEELHFDKTPLSEVLRWLSDEVRKLDPERKGINFIINPHLMRLDAPPINDLEDVVINIQPPLKDVLLIEALNAIVESAGSQVRFIVEDYGVVFISPMSSDSLITRVFKVNPNLFLDNLKRLLKAGAGDEDEDEASPSGATVKGLDVTSFAKSEKRDAKETGRMIREFLKEAGVRFPPDTTETLSPKIFFNDKNGILMVRATAGDMKIVEAAVEILSVAPPIVTIETKWAEITVDPEDPDAIAALQQRVAEILPNLDLSRVAGSLPGQGVPRFTPRIAALSDQGVVTDAPADEHLSGVLPPDRFQAVIEAFERTDGVDVLSAPRVTTLSGRQAQVAVIDLATFPKGPVGGTNVFSVPLGPTLDVLPYVDRKGGTIQMTMIPNITEFLGYEDPDEVLPKRLSAERRRRNRQRERQGEALVINALPRFRVRTTLAHGVVADGHTIVLGGMVVEDDKEVPRKTLAGRLFGSKKTKKERKCLLIFVTPTLVDPAGNRVKGSKSVESIPPWVEADRKYRGGR